MTYPQYEFDVIIVGGGPAGCATALSLLKHRGSQTELRVLLLDNADGRAYKIGESLPAAAKRTLPALNPALLPRLMNDTANGLHDICTGNASAWASGTLHETHAIMNLYGTGWHLDRAHFDETLRQTCGAVLQKGRFISVKDFSNGSPVTPLCASNDQGTTFGWEVEAEMATSGQVEKFRTRWIVDATGRKASVAQKLGAKTRKHHDLLTFYFLFDTVEDPDPARPNSEDRDTRTLIEASPSGWWYTARLPHRKRLVTYTTTPSDPTARLARNSRSFLDLLYSETTHIAQTLHRSTAYTTAGTDALLTQCTEPLYELPPTTSRSQCTSAGSSVLEPYASWEAAPKGENSSGRGWCAVGDAALAFDPLSSQGIITALDSGAFLGTILSRSLSMRGLGVTTGRAGSNEPSNAIVPSVSDVVYELTAAYERVREKYERGRKYYYDIVRRFDVDGIEPEEDVASGKAGKRDGTIMFWKGQRTSP